MQPQQPDLPFADLPPAEEEALWSQAARRATEKEMEPVRDALERYGLRKRQEQLKR